jgi:hypothetical protein
MKEIELYLAREILKFTIVDNYDYQKQDNIITAHGFWYKYLGHEGTLWRPLERIDQASLLINRIIQDYKCYVETKQFVLTTRVFIISSKDSSILGSGHSINVPLAWCQAAADLLNVKFDIKTGKIYHETKH